jgi:hypothetical protein
MRRLAIILTASFLLPLSARADDASKRAKIEQLFDAMHMDRTLKQTMDAIEKSVVPMTQQMFGQDVPEPMKKEVADFQKQLFNLIEDQMGWEGMEPAYIDIYARNFTEEQIDDLVTFYKTPTGQALIDKLPTITAEAAPIAQAKMVSLQPQIQKLIQDFAAKHIEEIKRAQATQKSGV